MSVCFVTIESLCPTKSRSVHLLFGECCCDLSAMLNTVDKDMATVKTAMVSATVTFLYFVGSVATTIHRRDFHIVPDR